MDGNERWASFDCYGTLIDWNGGVSAALQRLWPDIPARRMLARYHAVEPLIQEDRSLRYREVHARALRAIAAIEGVEVPKGQEYALADSLPSWPAFTDVPPALTELRRRGWKLAILSNTDPDLLEASMKQIGVLVDLKITAAEAGSYKPAPGHWDRFYERTGVPPARHVHVAASLFHDIAPCAKRGIRAVWINRDREESDLQRAAELRDLTDLPDVLDGFVGV